MKLTKPNIPDWSFEGFHYPYDVVMDTWNAYRYHGILLVSGGYLDQPAAWWADMHACDALFNTKLDQYRTEAEARHHA